MVEIALERYVVGKDYFYLWVTDDEGNRENIGWIIGINGPPYFVGIWQGLRQGNIGTLDGAKEILMQLWMGPKVSAVLRAVAGSERTIHISLVGSRGQRFVGCGAPISVAKETQWTEAWDQVTCEMCLEAGGRN